MTEMCGPKRVVLWGFRTSGHSHRYIHEGWSRYLHRADVDVIWVDDRNEMNAEIKTQDLVVIPDVHLASSSQGVKHVFRDDVFYLLHHGETLSDKQWASLDPLKTLIHYEYRKSHMRRLGAVFPLVRMKPYIFRSDPPLHSPQPTVLVHPWGSALRSSEFLDLPSVTKSKDAFFVGTVWGDEESKVRGNRAIIRDLGRTVRGFGLNFAVVSGISERMGTFLIRQSRISLSPGSFGHHQDSYLQCRTFKNISLGQPTATDVPGFSEILGGSFVAGDKWGERIEYILTRSRRESLDLLRAQQQAIQDYTYEAFWDLTFALLSHGGER